MEEAKELFLKYNGNYFYMEKDGVLTKYKSFGIDKNLEESWLNEYQEHMIKQIEKGNSVEVYVSKVCDIIRQRKDVKYLSLLLNVLDSKLKYLDSFVKLVIAEDLNITNNYLIENDFEKTEELNKSCKIVFDIVEDIVSKEIYISSETRDKVLFEDTLKTENILKRANKLLKK